MPLCVNKLSTPPYYTSTVHAMCLILFVWTWTRLSRRRKRWRGMTSGCWKTTSSTELSLRDGGANRRNTLLSLTHKSRHRALETFNDHWMSHSCDEAAFARIHEQLRFVVSSEAAAERSLSRQGVIRSSRFKLSPDQCEQELILAFNELPEPESPKKAKQNNPSTSPSVNHEQWECPTV